MKSIKSILSLLLISVLLLQSCKSVNSETGQETIQQSDTSHSTDLLIKVNPQNEKS